MFTSRHLGSHLVALAVGLMALLAVPAVAAAHRCAARCGHCAAPASPGRAATGCACRCPTSGAAIAPACACGRWAAAQPPAAAPDAAPRPPAPVAAAALAAAPPARLDRPFATAAVPTGRAPPDPGGGATVVARC